MSYVLSRDDLEAIARVANTEVGHFYSRGYSDWAPAVNAVFDTVVNRIGSREREFARDQNVNSALNRRGQFSAVSGNRNAAGSWQNLPSTASTPRGRAVRDQVAQAAIARAAGAPAPIAGALHFGNPTRSVLERVGASPATIARMAALDENATARYGRGTDVHVHGTSAPYSPVEGEIDLSPELAAELGYGNPETAAARGLLPGYITGDYGVPTPRDKPNLGFAIETPERASQRQGARDIIGQIDTINAAPVTPVERGLLGDLATAAPTTPVERGVLADLAAPARDFPGFGMNTPERASQREQQQEQGATRGLLDGFGDLTGARAGISDAAPSLGRSMAASPSGVAAPRDVGILDFAGLSAPTAAPAAVPDVAAGPVLASASGRVGPGINPTGFASATISAPTRNDRASAREQEQEEQGINFDIDRVATDRTTLGLLGQLGAPEAVVQRAQERERARQQEEQAAALQAPMQAPALQAAPAMPAMAPAREIASMPTPQGPGSGPAVTVPGAVPEVAAAVNRYGLDPDPGPGRAYGYSPWGSGVSISYDTAPDRVRDAGTGPGLFGAFNDAFGVDLTPSPGFMTGPIAMGLDAAGGGGLFSLGNMLGGSRSLVDRMDVVDRATRDRIDGPRDEGSTRSGGSGGLLGGFLSDPLGSAGRQARSELGTLGELFGWGGDTRGAAATGTSGAGSSGGGFLSGLGDILGGIFGGYEPTDRDSRSGSMGGVGSASARGFY